MGQVEQSSTKKNQETTKYLVFPHLENTRKVKKVSCNIKVIS
jgi:hypothetical protein